MKPIEQCLHTGVGVDIQVHERESIARQELLDTQCACRMTRADQYYIALVSSHERHPTQDKRTHEQLAQSRVSLHHCAQLIVRDREHLAVRAHTCPNEAANTAQSAHLAGKTTRLGDDEELLLPLHGEPHDFDAAGENDEQIAVPIAGLREDLALVDGNSSSVGDEPGDLCGGQCRECLLPAFAERIGRRGARTWGFCIHTASGYRQRQANASRTLPPAERLAWTGSLAGRIAGPWCLPISR